MYEYIKGDIAEITPTYVVVEAAGVGYYMNISLRTYTEIEKCTSAKVFAHYIVREDAQILYGFATKPERELFRLLIGVSGVGGNTARMVLSTYSTKEVASIISTENATLLKNVKGLGLKTAQKIIVELKDKLTGLAMGVGTEGLSMSVAQVNDSQIYQEAISALTMLGFPKAASDKALRTVLREKPDVSVEDLIRMSLKRL